MPTITVVGAGFSGLASAYFLTKHGFKVRIIEKSDRAGGLIRTIRTEHGLVETEATAAEGRGLNCAVRPIRNQRGEVAPAPFGNGY